MPRRPSELWELKTAGFSSETCLDFDLAVLDYWDNYQAKASQQKPVPAGPPLGKNMTMGPKYETNEDIFLLYRPPVDDEVAASDILEPDEIEGLLEYLDETTDSMF